MKGRKQQWHVCAHTGPEGSCPQLVSRTEPCPKHGRPLNQPWSKDRDRNAQRAFRTETLARDGYKCVRCGHTDLSGRTLEAHHVSPAVGQTLCNSKANGCHAAVDSSAR